MKFIFAAADDMLTNSIAQLSFGKAINQSPVSITMSDRWQVAPPDTGGGEREKINVIRIIKHEICPLIGTLYIRIIKVPNVGCNYRVAGSFMPSRATRPDGKRDARLRPIVMIVLLLSAIE